MFSALRRPGLKVLGITTGLGLEALRFVDEHRVVEKKCNFLISLTKSASVCSPTDNVIPPSHLLKGWSAGERTLPAHTFRFSHQVPETGFDGNSQKLLRDTLKAARLATDVQYAKIGQCNEDQLQNRAWSQPTYPYHIYDRNKFVVLMHGILGLPDGRFFESTGAKTNNGLQDVRLNEQLEPEEMVNGNCHGTLDRPIAIYMMPVLEEYDNRPTALTADVAAHRRVVNDNNRKEESDRQQEGEDAATHDLRIKFLRSQRCAQSNIDAPRGLFVRGDTTEDSMAVAKPKRKTALQSMALFDGKKNKLLGGWSNNPSSTEHRATVESGYLIDALKDQLGDAKATERLNAITGKHAYHTCLAKLSKPDSGLTGFPVYNDAKKAKALQQAVKDRWLSKPPALKSNFFRSA